MRKKLPFAKSLISYEPSVNHITGIINSDFDRFQCAFYNNFIDIVVTGAVDFCRAKDWRRYDMFEMRKMPIYEINILMQTEIISMIKNWIDQQNYILVSLETFYISNYKSFQSKHICHFAMIIGYDDEKESFLCADFFDFTNYSVQECLMWEIAEAIRHNMDESKGEYEKDITLLRVEKNAAPMLDLNRIVMSLQMLLTNNNKNVLRVYGLCVFDRICSMIHNGIIVGNEVNYRRYSQFLIAHISAMIIRIEYIQKRNNSTKLFDNIKELIKIKNSAEQYRNYILKLLFSKTYFFPESAKKIYIQLMSNLKNMYTECIKDIMNELCIIKICT